MQRLARQPSEVADMKPAVVDGEGRILEAPCLVPVLEDDDVW